MFGQIKVEVRPHSMVNKEFLAERNGPCVAGSSRMNALPTGMKSHPFKDHGPDVILYPLELRTQQMAALQKAVTYQHGSVLIVGESGTGKSLLARHLASAIAPEKAIAQVSNSHLPDLAALFQAILFDLDLPYQLPSEQLLRLAVTEAIMQRATQGGLVLFIDDAHHLQNNQLEELRLLGNLMGPKGQLFTVVLAGQLDLLRRMRQAELCSFAQSMVCTVQLTVWTEETVKEYLHHELRQAGLAPRALLDDEATSKLTELSHGTPRFVQRLAEHALHLAMEVNQNRMDVETILLAAEALGLSENETDELTEEAPSLPMDVGPNESTLIKRSA